MMTARTVAFALILVLCGSALTAAESPLVFRDVAEETGLTKALRGMIGHTGAWGDVNGDGKLDLFVGTYADRPKEEYVAGGARGPVPNRLLIQRDGKFVLSEEKAMHWLGRASGAVLADLDNDGWSDLYVSNNGRLGNENLLYHNLGKGRFKNVTAQAGASLELPETSRSVATADFDGDGLLDLIVLGTIGRSETMLFRNLGGMKFERSKAIPGDATGLGVAVADVTGNSWPDIMIGGSNRLFVNLGKGKFREAVELGLDWGYEGEGNSPSCGVAFGDVDRDGDFDLVIGAHFKAPWNAPESLRLFLNMASTTKAVRFVEVTVDAGLVPYPMKTPHVEIRDFDNDGRPDLYTAVVTTRDGKVHPAIYRNRGPSKTKAVRFEETAFVQRPKFPEAEDLAPGQRTAAFYDKLVANRKVMYFAPGPSGDFDGDGRLDLFLCSWWPKYPSMLLRNETEGGNYLDVRVQGSGMVNRMGVGCVVRAYVAGTQTNPRGILASEQIAVGYGFCSGQAPVAHLGLGRSTRCDIVITLPNGQGQLVRTGLDVNQAITVKFKGKD